MSNSHWEKEEFEDLVSKSLISMYEKNIRKECFRVPNFIKPKEIDLLQLKKIGS
jgi:hypothetical protein